MKKLIIMFVMCLCFMGVTQAAQITGVELKISQVFSAGYGDPTDPDGGATDRAGFYVQGGFPVSCNFGLMYIDLTRPAGRANLGLVMMAFAQDGIIVRIDYVVDSNGACHANSIHVQK